MRATQARVASLLVPLGRVAPLDGFFRGADLATPVTLLPFASDRIAGLDIGACGDGPVWDAAMGGYPAHVSGRAVNAWVPLAGAGAAIGGLASSFSDRAGQIGDVRAALFGSTLAVSPVPEPVSAVLWGVGALLRAGCRQGKARSRAVSVR